MPFDLDAFLALPRISGLALAPDGSRLVTSVATVAPDGTKFLSALWQLDPAGEAPPRRLTRSAKGETGAAFLPDGSIVFTSARPDPEAKKGDERDDRAALWLLPAGGGEARLLADPPAGVDGLAVARDQGTVVLGVGAYPGSGTLEEDAAKHKARKEAGVTAQLFESYPIRYWDHYIGPRDRRLYRIPFPAPDDDSRAEPELVLDGTGQHLDNEVAFDVAPDGVTVLTGWQPRQSPTDLSTNLLAVDAVTGERRTLDDTADIGYDGVRCSPDGRSAMAVRYTLGDTDHVGEVTLWLVDLGTGEGRDLTPELDLWPHSPVWAPDSSAVYSWPTRTGGLPPSGSTSPPVRSPGCRRPGRSPTCARPPTAPRSTPSAPRSGPRPRPSRSTPPPPNRNHDRYPHPGCPWTCPAGSRR